NQESRLPPGSDFRRWVWITIAPFVTTMVPAGNIAYSGEVLSAMFLSLFIRQRMLPVFNAVSDFHG
ncbi:hypothetical protein, partial [Klebsiella quasipneumoniae]|uniref:hypothetical protein n=1 Tax=Klebsiella quasipneumoniae TaxID=1463165 RepID=UPI00272F54D9